MPRLEFSKSEEFVDWLSSRDSSKYEIYYCSDDKLVTLPTVSTRPVIRAVYTGEINKAVKKKISEFSLYKLDDVEWKSESPFSSKIE